MSRPKTHSKGVTVISHFKPKTQNENNTNIHIVTGNLPITKFMFKVVEQRF